MIGFMNRRSQRVTRSWIATLVIVVTLGHALIPVGFMPSGSSGFPLVLCPGHALEMPDRGTNPHREHGGSHHGAPICPFAAASVFGAAPSFAGTPVAALTALSPASPESPSRTTDLSGPPRVQSARAPPLA
jgi:hypothetical protein